FAERTEQLSFLSCFYLAVQVENRIGGDPLNIWNNPLQRGKILGRKKFHFDPDLAPVKLEIFQSFSELVHRIFSELTIDPQIVDSRVRPYGRRLHVDSHHADPPVRRNDTDR